MQSTLHEENNDSQEVMGSNRTPGYLVIFAGNCQRVTF